MQLPENQTPETEVSADITPTDVKENNKKKAKRLLIFLGIALVVLLLLNLIPFDKLTELALNQIPEETEPAVTYADEFFVPPDYNEDVLQDEIYTKFNLDMTFTREGESFGITQANADDYGAVCQMFYNYFEYLKAGDTDACNALFTDEYFAEKRNLITAAEELLAQNEAQLAELIEEQAENYLDEDNFPDGKMTDANIKKRVKALDKKADAEELAVLQKYLDLKGDISLNKKLIKERKYDLLTALLVKYADLSEEDIKRLVIEKKWLAELDSRLNGEMQRISQQLTSKVSALAERYAQTLPEIDAGIADLEAKVANHFKLMGY